MNHFFFYKESIKFFLTFLCFGGVIAFGCTYFYYEALPEMLSKEATNRVVRYSDEIKTIIQDSIQKSEEILKTFSNDMLMDQYLGDKSAYRDKVTLEMIRLAESLPYVTQFRLIDEHGQEDIRVRQSPGYKYFDFSDEGLQNKAHRYYFKQAKGLSPGELGYSELDLNIEYHKIDSIRDLTFRVFMPVFKGNHLERIAVINLSIGRLIEEVADNKESNIFLLNQSKGFIYGNQIEYLPLNLSKTFTGVHNQQWPARNFLDMMLDHKVLVRDISHSNDQLYLAVNLSQEGIKHLSGFESSYLSKILPPIFLISIPIAFLFARFSIRGSVFLNKLLDENDQNLTIIDDHIPMLTLDAKLNITSVNAAFCRLLGYSKEALVHNSVLTLLYYKEEPNFSSFFRLSNKSQQELSFKKKNGQKVVLNFKLIHKKGLISNELKGVFSVEDITDKKLIEKLSQTDKLTALLNRSKLDEVLEKEIQNYQRHQRPVSIIFIDVDNFKDINDSKGHQAGDKVLINMAQLIGDSARKTDYVGRWGGDEFMVICFETKSEQALVLAEKIKQRVVAFDFGHEETLTISIGVSELLPGNTLEQWLKRVDDNLYRAKLNGKNQAHGDEDDQDNQAP